MPRRIRYNVATSLDGFIAPPDESTDWIVEDAGVDFVKLYEEFDTFIMGRKTYETMFAMGDQNLLRDRPKHSIVVISRHLDPADHPDVTVMRDGYIEHLKELKGTDGRDIWVMGGGWLATACLDAGLLDTVEAAIMPVVLREGFKLFTRGGDSRAFKLALRGSEQLPQSRIIMTRYDVVYEEANRHDNARGTPGLDIIRIASRLVSALVIPMLSLQFIPTGVRVNILQASSDMLVTASSCCGG